MKDMIYNYKKSIRKLKNLKIIERYYKYEIYNTIKRSYRRFHVRIIADSCLPKTRKCIRTCRTGAR